MSRITDEARRVIQEEATALEFLASNLPGNFEDAVEMIYMGHGRLIISGIGKSGLIGRKIAATMASIGQKSFYLHPSEASHGDLGMIDSSDILLLLSMSGESLELLPVIDFAKRYGNRIISISQNTESSLSRNADISIILPDFKEACSIGFAPTVSSTMTLAIGDAIAMSLIIKRGFTLEQFKSLHPGGAIGAKLSFVRDVMRTEIPIVQIGTDMQRAILVMSEYGCGCVGIVDDSNRLSGIITDGDLRRHMSTGLLRLFVDDVMTLNPYCVDDSMLCTEALHIMETRKITSLFVMGMGPAPIGMIHIHDLIMMKIV
ncbi:MAG: KpsF/GutQ family sugar-phosphate isomerase [Holosporales bacterium]|jgi:arabinose-5-phosphate isomerase|nr:KpsF/GutQ family sugar-phosphate isomerase [Holosporales bacterium]